MLQQENEKAGRIAKGSVEVPMAAFGSPDCDESILHRFVEDSVKLFGPEAPSAGMPSAEKLDPMLGGL